MGVVASLATLAACTRFGDSTADAPDGASPDGSDRDGTTAPDRPVDPMGADASRPDSACNTVHAFCDDFDRTTAGASPVWNLAPTIESGGAMNVRGFAGAPSSPNVVESRATSPARAILLNDITVSRGATCTFAFHVVARVASGSGPSFASLTLNSSQGAFYGVDLRLDSVVSAGKLADGGTAAPRLLPIVTTPDGKWRPVSIAMLFGPGGYVHVDIDGTPVLAIDGSPMTDIATATTARLGLGLQPLAAQGTWQVLYDDVVCDPIP